MIPHVVRSTVPALILMAAAAGSAAAQTGIGGWISALAAAPNGSIYSSLNYGGLFRSTNEGLTWTEPDTSMRAIVVVGLAAAPNGHLFACGILSEGRSAEGMFRSTDSGATWQHRSRPPNGRTMMCCAASPTGDIYAGGDRGVLRSTDEGASWTVVDVENGNGWVSAMDVARDGTLYFATGELPDRLIRYSPGGKPVELKLPRRFTRIDRIVTAADGLVYVSAEFEAMLRSPDRGATWTMLNEVPDSALEILGSDSTGALYGGTIGGVRRSTDNGATWGPANGELPATSHLEFVTTPNGHLFLSTNGTESLDGVFRSDDCGSTWERRSTGIYPYGHEYLLDRLLDP